MLMHSVQDDHDRMHPAILRTVVDILRTISAADAGPDLRREALQRLDHLRWRRDGEVEHEVADAGLHVRPKVLHDLGG